VILWQKFLLILLASVSSASFAQVAEVQATVGDKHLVILRPGVETLWGNYIFAVKNDSEGDAPITTRVMLPKEMVDFQPQDGVVAGDLQLGDSGLTLSKYFPPGLHIVSIGFKVDVLMGSADLTFTPAADILDFTLLTPVDDALLVSGPLVASEETPDPSYRAMRSSGTLPGGVSFSVNVSGVPEGRVKLWIIGSIVGVLMLLGSLALAAKTRPKLQGDETALAHVG